MYTLKNWYLRENVAGGIYASGTVFGHHRLEDGDFIHTSEIEKVYLCDDTSYVIETYSGSFYQLYVNEMKPEYLEETLEKLSRIEILDDAAVKDKWREVNEKLEKKRELVAEFEKTAREHMDEDGLYLIMEQMHVIKAVLKKGSDFREISADIHVGMFQDSVLITDWEKGEVDFRYFPNYQMEPYHWSDGLECVFIHNVGNSDIMFKGTKQTVECKRSEVTKIKKEVYRGEGLFSPDVVNGKSMLLNNNQN